MIVFNWSIIYAHVTYCNIMYMFTHYQKLFIRLRLSSFVFKVFLECWYSLRFPLKEHKPSKLSSISIQILFLLISISTSMFCQFKTQGKKHTTSSTYTRFLSAVVIIGHIVNSCLCVNYVAFSCNFVGLAGIIQTKDLQNRITYLHTHRYRYLVHTKLREHIHTRIYLCMPT